MIPPSSLLGGVAVAIVVGFVGGWTARDWKVDSDELNATRALIEAKEDRRAKVDAKAADFETLRQSIEPARTETRKTIREVYRNVPVPSGCALRPDALGMLENARQRANAATTGQSGEPVSSGSGDPADRP